MAITTENHPENDVFEVKFRNSETGTEAITRVTAPSIGEAGLLAKTKIRSLPGVPEHVLWVIRNCDDLVVERIERSIRNRQRLDSLGQ
jgi:hypothetical protein